MSKNYYLKVGSSWLECDVNFCTWDNWWHLSPYKSDRIKLNKGEVKYILDNIDSFNLKDCKETIMIVIEEEK